jgi:histidinol-phosphate aminotransferase
VLPSRANFVFARRPGVDGQAVYRTLKAEGILVRHFNSPEMDDLVRMTIGTDPQMDRLLDTVSRLWP